MSRTVTYVTRLLLAVLLTPWALQSGLAAGEETKAEAPSIAELLTEATELSEQINARASELAKSSPHRLFTRHLRSVAALVLTDWLNCTMLAGDRPELVGRSVEHMRKILAGLNGPAGQWDSYASGERSLIFAFVSKVDRTLQQYSVRLPAGWDPDRSYPTIVYLHGHVPKPDPLWYTALSFGPDKPKTQPATAPAPLEPHFSIGPWGRGNAGYRGGWEDDVWEALADAKATFRIDQDRLSLCGHSMGGFGTWSIGLRSPDVWSAMCIYSGGDRDAAGRTGLAGNIRHMPVYIWHGGKDRSISVAMAHELADILRAVGNEPVVVIDPDAGHMVPKDAKTVAKRWLLQHRRQRPKTLSFIGDTDRQREAWGITMRRDAATDPLPRFRCTVDGQTVGIDSEGTTGMDVQLGAGGLDLSGEVTVIFNGEQAYQGPVKSIKLGDGGGWRRRRR